ncbi:MAG TPA: hypothetical protein VGG74_11170 [Kofleriaceae bacterium]|jgi:hypothetical protein
MTDHAEHAFSLGDGGPFQTIARRLHLLRPSGTVHAAWLVGIAWLPLVLASAVRVAIGHGVDPLLHDISVHTRLLVALPLLVGAERMLDQTSRGALHQLYESNMVDHDALNALVDRAHRLRELFAIEAIFAVLAFGFGELVIWGRAGTGLVHGGTATVWSFARIWYGLVGLPIVVFLMARWFWRWIVWTYVLVRLSRLSIATIGTHPDRAAGLESLSWPLMAFCAYLLALSSILSGAWGTQLLDGRMTVPGLVPTLCLFVGLAYVVGCAPLLVFTGKLFRAHRRALVEYTPLAHDYVSQLQHKWIDGQPSEPLLGSPDFQSWHDIESAFENLAKFRPFVFGVAPLRNMLFASLLPLLPLLATTLSVEDVLRRIGGLLLGT